MTAILFSANPKQCDMQDAIEHLKTNSKLYFEVKFPIRKGSFPLAGFIHISGMGEKIQYVARIVGIEPFSSAHYEKPELYADVRPSKWIEEWQENKNGIQKEPWKTALVLDKIDCLDDFDLSEFTNANGRPAKAQRNYCEVNPPKKWAGFETCPIVEDLDSIKSKKDIDSTTKKALIEARVGQGTFRSDVLRLWDSRCCVTGSTTLKALRASHIKPWRESSDAERLDPNNGLPLVASLDALFDAGLISFARSGAMLVSAKLDETERKIHGLTERKL